MVGCKTDDIIFSESDAGASPKTLIAAADKQEKGIDKINEEAGTIYKSTKDDTIRNAASTITKTANSLVEIVPLLRAESESNGKVENLQKRCEELQTKMNSGEARMMLWLKIFGIVLMPIGLGLAWFMKSSEFAGLSVLGVLLMLSAQVAQFIDKFGIWLILLTIAAVGYYVFKVVIVSKRSLFGAVRVSEALKGHIKEEDPEYLEKMFGKGVTPGIVSHDAVTERLVTEARKKVLKKAAPLKKD